MEGSTGARRVGTTGDTGGTGTGHSGDAGRKGEKKRSLAQLFCLIVGLTLIAVGILGFLVEDGSSFSLPESVEGSPAELLGFTINGWENIIHLATGALLLFASAQANLARTVALVFGVVYALVTVLGFIDGDSVLGLFPVNTATNLLHAALAASALLAALLPTRDAADRAGH